LNTRHTSAGAAKAQKNRREQHVPRSAKTKRWSPYRHIDTGAT
jgi:hypothetical protein